MKKFFIIFFLFLPLMVFAQDKKKAILFYSEDSLHCQEVEKYFQKEKLYEKYEIKKVDISGEYNKAYLDDFFNAFKISQEKRGWPAIFFGNQLLVGSRPIIENFSSQMEESGTFEFPAPPKSEEYFSQKRKKDDLEENSFQSLAIMIIVGSLTDSINPCIFAAIFILIFILWPSSIRSKFIFSLAGFLLAIFLIRFFSGILLFYDMENMNLFRSILIVLGILAACLGILSLKYKLSRLAHSIHKMRIGNFSFITAGFIKGMIIGFFAGLFLLPNPKEPYIAFIKVISESLTKGKAFVVLSIYNFLFIIPLLALGVIISFLAKKKEAREFYRKNIELVRVVSGTILVFIGIYIIKIIFN